MIDGKIVVSEADRFNASLDTLNRMIDEDTEIVTIIVGEDGSVEEAEKLIAILVSENDELKQNFMKVDNLCIHTYSQQNRFS